MERGESEPAQALAEQLQGIQKDVSRQADVLSFQARAGADLKQIIKMIARGRKNERRGSKDRLHKRGKRGQFGSL